MQKAMYALASVIITALVITPFALATGEGNPLKGGARNPSSNPSLAFNAETQIIANNSSYGTRQSNKGTGGGAIYGCRAPVGGVPCLRSSNLTLGEAFQFETGGTLGGTITAAGGDNAKPFTTNATGVATGLNADRVDSLNASDIQAAAVTTARALTPFAQVAADGTLDHGQGRRQLGRGQHVELGGGQLHGRVQPGRVQVRDHGDGVDDQQRRRGRRGGPARRQDRVRAYA